MPAQAASAPPRPKRRLRRLHVWLDGLTRHATPDASGSALIGAQRIYILPTRTGFGFALMLFATLLGSLNYQNNLGLFFTFLMAGIALVSMHHCWFNLLGLRVAGRDALPVFCGQPAQFPILLTEDRGKGRGNLCVHRGGCAAPGAGGQARVTLSLPTRQRGELRPGRIIVETRHPLGLFRAWSPVRIDAAVVVYPRPAGRAPHPPEHETADRHARGDHGRGADDFIGPRPYQPGDSPRQLDWKALAGERGLVVKQFGGDHATRVWLDWQQHGGGTEQRLALLARQVLDAHERSLSFGMRLPGQFVERGRGEAHKHRCLEALARFPGPDDDANA